MTPQEWTNKHKVFGRIGSFWSKMDPDKAVHIARFFSHFIDYCRGYSYVQEIQDRILNQTNLITSAYELYTFDYSKVLVTGADFTDRFRFLYGANGNKYYLIRRPENYEFQNWVPILDEDGEDWLSDEDDIFLLIPTEDEGDGPTAADLLNKWLVPIPSNWIPKAIQQKDRIMLLGVDFFLTAGYLAFNEPVETLFPDNHILFIRLDKVVQSIYAYTYKTDYCTPHIAEYLRNNQSVQAYELAIAAAAGIAILPWDATLISVQSYLRVKYYAFDKGTIRVAYPHTTLPIGGFYQKNTQIGRAVRVTSDRSNPQWYRQLDWGNGLSLDRLCPVTGIVVPDDLCHVYVDGETDDFHVRIDFQGETVDLDKYWSHVKRNEITTGKYLNAVFGFADDGDETFVNGIDFVFQYLLAQRGVVVEFDTTILESVRLRKAKDFAFKEKPVGCVPIYKEI